MNFICGEYFAENSKHVFDNGYLTFCGKVYQPKGQEQKKIYHNHFIYYENEGITNNYIFSNPNYLLEVLSFIENFNEEVVLITHKLDSTIDENFENRQGINFLDIVNNPRIKHWYAQNAISNNSKVTYIPIGIECPRIGIQNIIQNYSKKNIKKDINFLINFNDKTRHSINNERIIIKQSLEKKGLYDNKFDFLNREQFINDLFKSYFCLSPMGAGIDCHRTWLALYCGAIPILSKNPISIKIASIFPAIVIDNWETFDFSNLNKDLYFQIKKNKLEINDLNLNNFIEILNIFHENTNSINSI